MFTGHGTRTLIAIGIVMVATTGVALLGYDAQPALIVLIGGIAAVLVAAGVGDVDEAAESPTERLQEKPAFQDVIDAIIEPVLIVGDGRVALANQAALALLGRHIVDQDVRLAIRHPGAAERLAGLLADRSEEPINLVGLGTRDQRWEMRISAVADGRHVVHLMDRSGSHAAEQMRVDFVANASHELRTPLASILGYVETLSEEAGEDAELRGRFLKIMFGEARRMLRLVEDLISLSRIEAEKYRLPDTPVDLVALIEEVRAELADWQDRRGHDIVLDLDPTVPPVAGDRAQLSQAFHNLVGNAMKYGRPGTPVTVRLRTEPTGLVRASVTDEGDGIAAEHLPRLTERFYRVDAGRSRAAGGTGLGLAIVKHIVERHRGRLDIGSVVGKGSTMALLLPPHPSAVIKR